MVETLIIGTVGYPIKKEKVLKEVDVIEMTEARHIPPGGKAARHLRSDMPTSVACTVQISRYFYTAPPAGATIKGDINAYGGFKVTDESKSLWKRQIDFASEMGADALVLITPAGITPSSANVSAMSEFFNSMDRGTLPIIWEPHGPWESSQISQFSKRFDLIPAVDPRRDPVPDGDIAYFRFGAFSSTGSRMSIYELEQILEAVAVCDAKKVYCLFETQRALDDVRNLKKTLLDDNDDEFDY